MVLHEKYSSLIASVPLVELLLYQNIAHVYMYVLINLQHRQEWKCLYLQSMVGMQLQRKHPGLVFLKNAPSRFLKYNHINSRRHSYIDSTPMWCHL